MSEMIKEFKKGDLLYIGDNKKAYWGLPQGYPYKEIGEHTITATFIGDEGPLVIERDGVVETIPDNNIDGLLVNNTYLRIADPIDQDAIKNMYINGFSISEMWERMVQMGMVTDDYVVYDNVFICTYKYGVTDPINRTWPTAGFYAKLSMLLDSYTMEWTDETIHTMATEFLPQVTSATHGTVKQMSYLSNVTGDVPTAENFNQLLRQLKNAGLMRSK